MASSVYLPAREILSLLLSRIEKDMLSRKESMDSEVHITGQQGSLRTFLCCAVVLLVHCELALEQRKTLGNQRGEHEPSSYGTKRLYCHAQT